MEIETQRRTERDKAADSAIIQPPDEIEEGRTEAEGETAR